MDFTNEGVFNFFNNYTAICLIAYGILKGLAVIYPGAKANKVIEMIGDVFSSVIPAFKRKE